jgi:hypothetical protein
MREMSNMGCVPFAGTSFKYEYQCISQDDEIVAEGEFVLRMNCAIRSPEIQRRGIFGVFDDNRETLSIYRGYNHLKKIKIKVTNMSTNSVRYIE